MSLKTLTRSLGGGEITPEMFGRIDLAKFQTGLKTCRNFEILPHGPAANRTGFEYVLETKFSTRKSLLLPFIYNTEQTYVLEFGNLYIRFHTDGGTVLEAAKTITSATNGNPGVFTKNAHGYANGDWLFFSGVTGMSNLNGRFMIATGVTANTYRLTDLAGVSFNTSALGTLTAGNSARVYEVASPYAETDLFDSEGAAWPHITQSSDVLTVVHPSYPIRELKRLGATNWTFDVLTIAPTQGPPTAPTATPSHVLATTSYTYAVTALAANTLEESLQTANATCTNDLTLAGHSNLIQWTDAAGAVRYNVYKRLNGLYGYIGQSGDGVSGLVDNNITPNFTVTPPLIDDQLSAPGYFPSAVGYCENRRWFAGSNTQPQGLYATRSGTESNMNYSVPTQANDRIAVRLTSRQNNTIRHIVPLSELLLLTSGGEWKVTGSGGVITPLSISSKPEDYLGASNASPVTTASAILYPQAKGGRIRELRFQWQQQGYRSADLSIMAPHLFDGYRNAQMAYVSAPYSTAWCVRTDGTLLGVTYVQEQEVAAWHHHDTAGTFESVCAVPEGDEDVLYAVVKRTINARTVRYLERKHTRQFGTLPYAFFVDAGVTYNSTATTTVSGLWHLEGATVSVLADGAVLSARVVTNGTVSLDIASSVVNIGLPYVSDLETLPMAIEGQMAAAQGFYKNVNKVYLRVNQSSGIFVGPSLSSLTEVKTRTIEPFGTPPNLVNGVIPVVINPAWGPDAGISVRQTAPLPLTVLSLVLETTMGG